MEVFSQKTLKELADKHGTPTFVYSKEFLKTRVEQLVCAVMPYGFIPRYAAKANTHPEIIRLLNDTGMHFDASSSYEANQLIDMGVDGSKISLSGQQPAHNVPQLVSVGVQYVATSLHQLRHYAERAPGQKTIGLRVNPGVGTGHNNRTTTGGVNSSFGLWSSYIPDALQLAGEFDITITRLHVHIGSGADPEAWATVMDTALSLVDQMPDVVSLDIGGGYKVHRYADEKEANMTTILAIFAQKIEAYFAKTGRRIVLEIEPGTWLVAHAGVLLSEIVDIVDTGKTGNTFLRLNTGMNDIIRPSMYGARHQLRVLNDVETQEEYVVVGHNCETGDILTPGAGDPESIEPRSMNKAAIGDIVAIYDVGAYCASFSAHGYNAFPNAKELVI